MKNTIFKEVHSQYEEAAIACKLANANTEYPHEIWKTRQLTFLSEAISGKSPRPQILSHHLSISETNRVMDYGGGSGWTLTLMESLGYQLQQKTIVETPQSISWFKALNPGLNWINAASLDLICESSEDSTLYSNSCVQYIHNFKETLTPLLENNWKYVIFEDLPNFSDRDIWTLQQYYGFSTAYHFFKIGNFINFVESMGYKLILQQTYIDSFPEDWIYEIQDGATNLKPNIPASLIFRRK